MKYDYIDINDMIGHVFDNVTAGDERLIFRGPVEYEFWHSPDCCESVYIADVIGELEDLINTPILEAEEVIYENERPPELFEGELKDCYSDESYTWTFYKFATSKGRVTVRWFGCSNGFYSERVNIYKRDYEER